MATITYGETDRTQGRLVYTTSSTDTSYTITLTSYLYAKSYGYSGYRVNSTLAGSTVKTKLDYVDGVYTSWTQAIATASYSKTYTKTHSSQSVVIGSNYKGEGAGGYYAGGKSGSTTYTITIPAKTSYTVSFNANGGSGAPSSQTKWHGETLTLSSTKPTRTGYTFLGWSTSSSATSATWAAGGSYTTNASDVLYAVWKRITYTISYNANGGSNAPSAQTKNYGSSVTIAGDSTHPTRTGYSFSTWNTKADGSGTNYAKGATYSTNANLTLYAIWTQITYSVTYNKNTTDTVTNMPSSQTKIYGTTLTLSSNTPVRENYRFLGWATSATATTAQYQPSSAYTGNAVLTLYAVWILMYNPPTITGYNGASFPTIYRCDLNGDADDLGQYANVSFSWATYSSDYPIYSIDVEYRLKGATGDYTQAIDTIYPTAATSGNVVNLIVGGLISGGAFEQDKTYNVRVAVTDKAGTTADEENVTSYYNTIISASYFSIDVGYQGHSVAIGTPAPALGTHEDLFTVGMDANFKKPISATAAVETMIEAAHGTANTGAYFTAKRTDTTTQVSLGVGSGGINHGVYSATLGKWLVYGDASTVYVNGSEFPVAVHTSTIANIITAATDITIIEAEVYTWGKLCQLRIRWSYGQAKNVPANGNISNITVGTLNSNFTPCMTMGAWSSGDQAGAAWYNITGGVVALGACEGIGTSYTIAAGTEFRLFTTYILA